MNKKIKNELGNVYGDFKVIAYTDERYSKNGSVMWRCECRYCGAQFLINGNRLRFHRKEHCPKCKKNRKG